MSEKLRVRVTLEGSLPKFELIVDGLKVCDLSYSEILDFIMQATSSLRWQKPK